jgi:hypothetical protein
VSKKQQNPTIQRAIEQLVSALQSDMVARIEAGLAGAGTAGSLEEIEKKVTSSESFRKAVREKSPAGGDSGVTKEALGAIIQSVLFESGILEKLVNKQIDSKLPSGGDGGGGGANPDGVKKVLAKELPELLHGELKGVAERQVRSAMAGEGMKTLLDDKFRAMSLYLKTDVIPKAVQKVLKETQPST